MQARWPLLALSALVLGAGAWLLRRPLPQRAPTPIVGTRLFEAVLDKVRTTSVDSLDDQELYRLAATGMIEELDDPYAVLLLPGQHPPPPEDAPIPPGVYLDRRDGLVVIVATVPGSPADSAGVKAGDRVLGVDSTVVDPAQLDRVATLLAGKPGSTVTLRLRRSGTRAPITVSVTRGPTPRSSSLDAAFLGNGVARIRVVRFVSGIADSVRRSLETLRGQGARSLVLDLRSTVGGELAQGVALADLFLNAGKVIAVNRVRPPHPSAAFTDSADSPFAAMPLVVLVDAGTAGAAEAVAGALQDHDRAAVLGSLSYGRGVTQSTFPLGQGASLSLTTALWITPSGRQIQRPPRPAAGDSVPRSKVKSDAGRVLLGGGGIMPDRTIAAGDRGDLALAEARRVLARASTPGEVFALVR